MKRALGDGAPRSTSRPVNSTEITTETPSTEGTVARPRRDKAITIGAPITAAPNNETYDKSTSWTEKCLTWALQ